MRILAFWVTACFFGKCWISEKYLKKTVDSGHFSGNMIFLRSKNNPKNNFFNAVVICIFSGLLFSCKEQDIDRYNLNFTVRDSFCPQWDFVYAGLDSFTTIDGKHPFVYDPEEQVKQMDLQLNTSRMYIRVNNFQDIIVPECAKSSTVEITLNSKSSNFLNLAFQVQCFNGSENPVYSDSVNINRKDWKKYKISFMNNNAKIIRLIISGTGFAFKSNLIPFYRHIPRIFIDRISITVDGKDIYSCRDNFAQQVKPLDYKNVMPLDSGKVDSIVIPKNKKIIALGESVHGCKTVNRLQIELVKKMILENNCKLVIFDADIFEMHKWNLFVQSVLPDYAIEELSFDPRMVNTDILVLREFFNWLRDFNKRQAVKVKTAGLRHFYNINTKQLFMHINYFYTRETAQILYPLLKYVYNMEFDRALEYMANTPRVKTAVGEDEFVIIQHLLKSTGISSSSKQDIETLYLSTDYYMWKHASTFVDILLKEDETAVIMAHSYHTQKKRSMHYYPPMGCYFDRKYGNRYFNINFHVGQGELALLFTKNRTANIFSPKEYSIEKLCLNMPYEYFYYRTDIMPDMFLYSRGIVSYFESPKVDLNEMYSIINDKYNILNDRYDILNIKRNADAFIFIRDGKPVTSSRVPLKNMRYINHNKTITVDGIMKKYRQEMEKSKVKK
ncbi:MAG: erythromycin esterase family protein [Prevotellaceae bacterium]|jgi:erythromycin esterase-like protein|nr:erythromycin esterase family protein [Prevotellaceae bacterium]